MKRAWDFDLQLFASGAGLNYALRDILLVTPNSTAYTTPLTGYGDLGNDSGKSNFAIGGMVLVEAFSFTKLRCMMLGDGSGYEVTIFVTNSPLARRILRGAINPGQALIEGVPTILPASEWVVATGPSLQSGEGMAANPMTDSAQIFDSSGPIVAVRAVLTALDSTPAVGSRHIAAQVVP